MIKIALLGFGTVGQGCYEILEQEKSRWTQLLGQEVKIVKILKRSKQSPLPLEEGILTMDFSDVMDAQPQIVVEMTGDLDASYIYIKESLCRGIHVVTANKAVVSQHLAEFIALAQTHQVQFVFESSVAGVIPIIDQVRHQSIFNHFSKIYGILNGTGNYILYNMAQEEKDFSEVLKEAQLEGYAEADPADDVKGYDAMRKLSILASIAFHSPIANEDIALYGFDTIKMYDVEKIQHHQGVIKHLAYAEQTDDGYQAVIEPVILPKKHYMARIEDALNAVELFGNYFGNLRFMGAGAGKYPTGNAVVSDILNILLKNQQPIFFDQKLENRNEQLSAHYYLRVPREFPVAREYIRVQYFEKEYQVIMTKNILRRDLLKCVESLDESKYFFARFEEVPE